MASSGAECVAVWPPGKRTLVRVAAWAAVTAGSIDASAGGGSKVDSTQVR